MSSTTKDATIQDYILNSIPAKQPTIKYEVVAQNNTDFIVRRTTLKTQRELVILISQGIFYIKDTKQQIYRAYHLGPTQIISSQFEGRFVVEPSRMDAHFE